MKTPPAEKNPMHENNLMFEKSHVAVNVLLSEEIHIVVLY
jgi:hypothetical protein